MSLRIVSWNIAHLEEPWRALASGEYDVALLQEAAEPPPDVKSRIVVDEADWALGGGGTPRRWRCAVVGLSQRVSVRHIKTAPVDDAGADAIPVSRSGTVAVAEVMMRDSRARFTVASIYGAWEEARFTGGSKPWIYADASVHRVISDLSSLIANQSKHRMIVAGDLNLVRGYGEYGNAYWAKRYATVFARMDAIGLPCVGPELPEGAPLRFPAPAERPEDSRTVPTFRRRKADPSSAERQLDFVFASQSLAASIKVRARDSDEDWGPSDHCLVEIDVDVG